MPNPFTSESRDEVLTLGLDGLITKLRAPRSLRRILVSEKPQHMGLGDFALKSMFDSHLTALIVAGRYRDVQTTLEAHFGPLHHEPVSDATDVAPDHNGSKKPLAKAK